jgi:molybdopterin molybdotransferase
VLCTGSELLAECDVPRDGHIRNANGPYLCAALAAMGAEVVLYRVLPDALAAYTEAVRAAEAAGAQVIVSTGAVSMGVHDFVPAALRSLQADIVFHKLAMRPGKPTLFAALPSGALLFGLPGNPMSSACSLRFFVQAALRAMQGRASERPRRAVLTQALDKKPGWTLLQRATLTSGDDGVLHVAVAPDQESFRIRPFVHADVWAVLPPEAAHLPAGSVLDVYPIDADAAG